MPLGVEGPLPPTTPGHTLQWSSGLLPSTGKERSHSCCVSGACRRRLRSHTSPAYTPVSKPRSSGAPVICSTRDADDGRELIPVACPAHPHPQQPRRRICATCRRLFGCHGKALPRDGRGPAPAPPDPPAAAHSLRNPHYTRTSNWRGGLLEDSYSCRFCPSNIGNRSLGN